MPQGVSSLHHLAQGIWRTEASVSLGPRLLPIRLRVNVYVLETPVGLYLVDCGPFALYYQLRAMIARSFPHRRVVRVYLTHGHFDHAGAGLRCTTEGIEVWSASAEHEMLAGGGPAGVPRAFRYAAFQPTNLIENGYRLALDDGRYFDAMLTPGHTAGSACFYDEQRGVLFYGDLLFGPLRGYMVTFILEFLTAMRQPREELRRQMESLGNLKGRLVGRSQVLLLHGHGPPYYLEERPGAFERSLGILRLVLRLKRLLPFF
ncbi:MAG: MBL fold metallo-hydrolase [Chloroflexi bacterium]|nr:MBL fold metallo-hydrolase [Chloroflexota bacterium]